LVGTGCYEPPPNLGGDYKGATVGTSPAFSFGSSVCEVEVDDYLIPTIADAPEIDP
jgi:hypothetical protein